ncbi:MAG TPA: hypothetical protein VFJ25_05900 [Casimicrobiaceae bacterium]|nr:hypothetical protein [Casimicrobiaceae bacterium]
MRLPLAALALAALLAGCTSLPKPVMPADENDPSSYELPYEPMVESPPIEPVEPPLASPATPSPQPPAQTAQTTQSPPPPVEPAPVSVVAPPPAQVPPEDQQMIALLADLQRFSTMQGDEVRRELATATQTFAKQRTDVNRVRLAVLYTLARTSPQDDQRALQLFENIARNAPANSPIRHLAAVLQAQVSERQRAVHDEQQKADAAIQKLEALRAMERSLLRDRVRSGGGGGGAGAGGSGR